MQGKAIKEFWIVNVSKMDVSLADLNVTVRSYTSVNLLDSAHYQLSEEQIQFSLEKGSLHKKRDKIKVRLHAPIPEKPRLIEKAENFQRPLRSGIKTTAPKYEELDISDEKFAEELAETAEQDRSPRHSRN